MTKSLSILCLVFVAVASQDDGLHSDSRDPNPSAPPPSCPEDSFSLAAGERCPFRCVVRDINSCPTCNRTCNDTLRVQRCNFREIRRHCSLSCPLAVDDNGCPMCECDDADGDRTAIGAIDPCRVNSTVFAEFGRCNPRCVSRRDDGCFMCDTTCNNSQSNSDGGDECGIRDRESCANGSICLLKGLLNTCVRMPRHGDECEIVRARDMLIDTTEVDGEETSTEEDDEEDDGDDHYGFFSLIQGALDRLRVYSLRVSIEMEVPCSDGTTCSREQRHCVNVSGPCTAAQRNGTHECDEDGNFAPLQCRRMQNGSHTCHCVHPHNGHMVHGTRRTGIRSRGDVPDCEAKVFKSCKYEQGGHNYTVRHRDKFINRRSCMKCHCNDGNATNCRQLARIGCNMDGPQTTPQSCTHGRRTIQHGERKKIGKCNVCGCNNGSLICTDIEGCNDDNDDNDGKDEKERKCEICQDAPKGLVCGRDGRTYHSRCIAMNCSGLGENDTLDGPCTNQPVCTLYPCRPEFTCIPLGGRSCLRKGGCTADERRICVNRTALRCKVSNTDENGFDTEEEREEDMVCGSDRRTYKSFCHMIKQAPPNTKVAHARKCHHDKCNSGQVCGTDGVTYNSVCHLHAQSANAQVDYKGRCVDDEGASSLRDVCRTVRKTRCEENDKTCKHRVHSRDGCCPVCGGITTLAIDRDALDEYSRATDSDANLDEFMARMTRDDVIPEDVRRRCLIEATHVRNSTQTNIEVKILAKNKTVDSHFCHNHSKAFADRINNATTMTTGSMDVTTISTLPVEASFASAAAAAPLIVDQTSEGNNGAPSLNAFGYLTYLALLGVALANMAATV